LVHQPGLEILADGGDAAPDPDILARGGGARLFQRGMNAAGDEPECRAPGHRQGGARMVREHENLAVIRRRIAPPALPLIVGPGAPHRPEHVAAHDPGPDIPESGHGELVVETRGASPGSHDRLVKRPGAGEPRVQTAHALPEGMLKTLPGAGAESVERDREA